MTRRHISKACALGIRLAVLFLWAVGAVIMSAVVGRVVLEPIDIFDGRGRISEGDTSFNGRYWQESRGFAFSQLDVFVFPPLPPTPTGAPAPETRTPPCAGDDLWPYVEKLFKARRPGLYFMRVEALGWPRPCLYSYWIRTVTGSPRQPQTFAMTDTLDGGFQIGRAHTGGMERPFAMAMPYTPHAGSIAFNIVVYMVGFWLVGRIAAVARALYRKHCGRCPKCGYDTRAQEHQYCSECGWRARGTESRWSR